MISILVVFYIIAVPLRTAFQDTVPDHTFSYPFISTKGVWLVLDMLADIIFIADIGLNCVTVARYKGEAIIEPRQIRKIYLRTWFPLDVIASFPTSFLAMDSESNVNQSNKLVRLLRLAKLTRLFRVFKLNRIFRRLAVHSVIHPGMMRVLRLSLVLFFVWHMIACGYWGLSLASGFCDSGDDIRDNYDQWGNGNNLDPNGFVDCLQVRLKNYSLYNCSFASAGFVHPLAGMDAMETDRIHGLADPVHTELLLGADGHHRDWQRHLAGD
jgi:hypothetical protein